MESMKICFKCKMLKPLEDFYKHPDMTDGHVNKCKECNKRDVRENYARNTEKYRAYDKNRQRMSIKRILDHRYNSLKSRSLGKNGRIYRVTGKPFLSREEWNWWNEKPEVKAIFMQIYAIWEDSGYATNLMPSIDRINNNGSYTLDNIQWLSKHENSVKYTKGSV